MRYGIRGIRSAFSRNIQVRLTFYFLIMLLPMAAISLYAVEQSKRILYDQTVERAELSLSSTMDAMNLNLHNVEQLSTLIATDRTILRLLEGIGPELTAEAVADFSAILRELANIKSANPFVQRISVYHEASRTLLSTGYGARRLESGERRWLTETVKRIGTGILYSTGDGNAPGTASRPPLLSGSPSLIRSMDLYNARRRPNGLILSLDPNKLRSMIRSLLPSPNAYISLYGQDGTLIVGEGRSATAETYRAKPAAMLEATIRSPYSGWRMTLIQPKDEVFRRTDQLQGYIYLIAGLSVLLAFVISWTVYRGIAAPVKRLARGMKRMGAGELDVTVTHNRKDELGYLTDVFNRMALYQKRLIRDHYEQQLRIARTELKFLQSQINPHFLYNTLDSIYWTSKNYEAEEIGEMVLNLSKFFRLSLNKGKDVITVRESVEHLHYYVRIQQLKSLDSFSVRYEIGPEAEPVPILKLLLQPLVENAILHGMEGKSSGGELVVSARIDGSELLLEVRDNGQGMAKERLDRLQAELDRLKRRRGFRAFPLSEEETADFFGLRNTMARIRLYYGDEAGLSIASKEGEGTAVVIRLPLGRCRYDIFPAEAADPGLRANEL